MPVIPKSQYRRSAVGYVGVMLLAATVLLPGAAADPAQHRHYQVFVGSAFFLDHMANKAAWPYTASHVDGFYNHPVGWRSLNAASARQVLANVAHKTAIVEGDLSGPVAGTVKERDTVVGEMAADGMPTQALFENQVKPNKPQNTVTADVLAADQAEWTQFCRDTHAKTGAATYFMTAAFQIAEDFQGRTLNWDSPAWAYMHTDIQVPDCAGAGLDSPVDNYLLGPPTRRQAVWDMTRWTQRQGKRFIYLTSPGDPAVNNNGTAFIQHLRQTVASLEDNDAEPDTYAVESYIPTGPDTVPESGPDGAAAGTITGGAYYLLKHRDGEPGTLHLTVVAGETDHPVVTLTNSSAWLDYAPVLKANVAGHAGAWTVKFSVGGVDVTPAVLGAGYLFYQAQRLNPQTSQQIVVTLTRKKARGPAPPLHLILQVLPHTGSAPSAHLQIRHV